MDTVQVLNQRLWGYRNTPLDQLNIKQKRTLVNAVNVNCGKLCISPHWVDHSYRIRDAGSRMSCEHVERFLEDNLEEGGEFRFTKRELVHIFGYDNNQIFEECGWDLYRGKGFRFTKRSYDLIGEEAHGNAINIPPNRAYLRIIPPSEMECDNKINMFLVNQ